MSVYDKRIPQWLCLCQICEKIVLLAYNINKLVEKANMFRLILIIYWIRAAAIRRMRIARIACVKIVPSWVYELKVFVPSLGKVVTFKFEILSSNTKSSLMLATKFKK